MSDMKVTPRLTETIEYSGKVFSVWVDRALRDDRCFILLILPCPFLNSFFPGLTDAQCPPLRTPIESGEGILEKRLCSVEK